MLGSGRFVYFSRFLPVGKDDDMFPSYIPVSKVNCTELHQVEIFLKFQVTDDEYNFNYISGLPNNPDKVGSLDIEGFFKCTLESSIYLNYPVDYTGLSIGYFYDAADLRRSEKSMLCFYWKYKLDDLGQQDGIDSKTGSARLIKERIPKIDFFDFTENLNNLEVGSCWFDQPRCV